MLVSHSRRFILVLAVFCGLIGLFARFPGAFPGGEFLMLKLRGKATVSDRLSEFGLRADTRWQPFFQRAGVPYPPKKLVFLGLKQEKQLEIYAQSENQWKFVRALPILAASGKIGPKRREGDLQVPEGFYKIESLNPNSSFHLALRVNYPSQVDRDIAEREGRSDLGGDIMIHGSNASVGCLAMGDVAAEDLFVLAGRSGLENIDLWLCPLDFRRAKVPDELVSHWDWVRALYENLENSVRQLPKPPL